MKMHLLPEVAAPRGLPLKTFMGKRQTRAEETDTDSPLAGLVKHMCLCLLCTDVQTAARTLKTTSYFMNMLCLSYVLHCARCACTCA